MREREYVIKTLGSEAPTEAELKRVADCIGVPPKAKTFYMLTLDLSDISEDRLERILDVLYAQERIQVVNGWIAGVSEQARRIKHALDNMTSDDFAWLTGTGRFAQ